MFAIRTINVIMKKVVLRTIEMSFFILVWKLTRFKFANLSMIWKETVFYV